MEALKRLYIATSDNHETVMFATNLKDFVSLLNDMNVSDRNYQYFYRRFEQDMSFTLWALDGTKYHLHRLK